MRFTNDNLIRAIHVGEPIIDLGTLVDRSPSSGKIGVLFKNGFGILADDVTEFEEQVTVEEIDPLVLKLKGNITKAIGKINSKLIPIASFESIFTDEFINTLSSLMSQGSWI